MKTKRFYLLTAISAVAFTFLACSDDSSGDAPKLCGGVEYDVNIYRCDSGELIGKCKGADFYPAYQVCDNGVIEDKASSSSSSLSSMASSSSVALSSSSSFGDLSSYSSSSSVVPSSSSVVPSSSSVAMPSSSSVVPSSSSVVLSSSSVPIPSSSSVTHGTGLCSDFTEGDTRIHYGKSKAQFCDSRDGKKYVYVKIGTQTWMAENLNYAISGSKCSNGNNMVMSDENTPICDTYGRLYNWATAMAIASTYNTTSYIASTKHRGICPVGWHIPSHDEWYTLLNTVGSSPGTKLKTASVWEHSSGIPLGTDEYGFSALPGGGGNSAGAFSTLNLTGYWWSSSELSSNINYYRELAYTRVMSSNNENADYIHGGKSQVYSVRCLQD